MPVNLAVPVRGPAHSQRRGKTPVLDPPETHALLDAIDVSPRSHCATAPLRHCALIAMMPYSFARVGAALGCRVEDVFIQNRHLWVRLHEKDGKRHEMRYHHRLEGYLHAYLEGCGIAEDRKGPLFRTIARGTGQLSRIPPAPGQCLSDGATPRCGSRDRDDGRQPLVPRDRDHRLSEERWNA